MRDFFKRSVRSKILRLAGAALVAGVLAGCQADELGYGPKSSRALDGKMTELMEKVGVTASSPVLMRIFKEESKFEVWKADASGRYRLLKTYDICKWSGRLGPKIKEGDRQAPEGFYAITPGHLNPNSAYYLSFNTGFPNAYDRANGRTGTALMVHGACSSRGCYAMTDEQIGEIYALARDAFKGGQKAFQLQAFPFRMTAENMARHWDDPARPFWQMLKEGYDTFELTRQEPKVDVCGRKYVFNATPKGSMNPVDTCPELVKPADLQIALATKAKADEAKAIVMAAKFRAEREEEEQRQILIARTIEEERRRAEATRLAAAERGKGDGGKLFADLAGSITGLVGVGGTPAAATVADGAPTDPAAAGAVAPDGAPAIAGPLPRPDPRTPAVALAMAEPAPAPAAQGVGSMFGRLFSFGGSEPAPETATEPPVVEASAAAPNPPATDGAASAAPPPVMARSDRAPSAPVPAKVPPSRAIPADPTVVASIAPAQPTPLVRGLAPVPAPAAACAPPPADPAKAASAPACPPIADVAAAAPAAPPSAEDRSIMDRIGSWF